MYILQVLKLKILWWRLQRYYACVHKTRVVKLHITSERNIVAEVSWNYSRKKRQSNTTNKWLVHGPLMSSNWQRLSVLLAAACRCVGARCCAADARSHRCNILSNECVVQSLYPHPACTPYSDDDALTLVSSLSRASLMQWYSVLRRSTMKTYVIEWRCYR